ncbi:Aminoglycoside phosphotransferase [Candidatus Rhodobacter oscarellae]|uniref:Aminoglycoside phosphotransferase n=1 Tax=Candidatus Rhodobacter oscarellae TaxID=1675527 RepID=A0A0J9E2T3_9RHOB|nr:phosphotransferase [Candidatus Rhodobacter lobularis]KMW57151.1 Aminoglycoside phosphotransferase [Candidatus Rhodobacter lobularis]
MLDDQMPLEELLQHLQALAQGALSLWDLPAGAAARLINVSENATYLVEAPGGWRAVLRVHRAGYHSRDAIQSELAWMAALEGDGVVATPQAIAGKDGALIQTARTPGLEAPRFLVLFHFIDGAAPDETGDLRPSFETLGAIAARVHEHSLAWSRPAGFERMSWDLNAVFGPDATWGDWRAAPHVGPPERDMLEQLQRVITQRLTSYGTGAERFGLIHADMRLANLLVHKGQTRVIDFDDCGFGWLMYDFAAAISFIETSPEIPNLKAAWLRGYRSVRALPPADEAEIDTFVMLRRMALLAWIGSHIEAPEPQEMAPHFAEGTVRLARAFLARQS